MRAFGVKPAWLTIKPLLITLYNDVYDEHLFVFAAGLSYYFVLSLFPLLVSIASLLGYVPIPHLFEGLLSLVAKLVPGDGMSLVRNIVSDVISHKHTRPALGSRDAATYFRSAVGSGQLRSRSRRCARR